MTKIKTLKSWNEDHTKRVPIAPRTHTKAVFDDNGNTLDSLMAVQDEKLSELGSEIDNTIVINKEGLGGGWYGYKMTKGNRYRVINTGNERFNAWNATSQDLDSTVDVLCSELLGGNKGPIITATENTNFIRIGYTNSAISCVIQDLDTIDGNLILIKEGRISDTVTLKSKGNEFLPFNFIAGHKYRIVNLSDSAKITLTVALDNNTIPANGEILCKDLSVGDVSNVVIVNQNAPYLRIGEATGGAVFSIIDLDVYNGKITSKVLDDINEVRDLLNNGYLFKGIATPNTVPVIGKNFYIATEPGDYSNFGRGVFSAGNILIIKYENGYWMVESIPNITTTIDTILYPFEIGSGIILASDGSIVQTGSNGRYDGNIQYARVKLNSYDKYTNLTFKAHASSIGGGYGFIVNGVWVGYKCPNGNEEITLSVPDRATEFRTFWNRNVYPTNDIVCNKPINANDIVRIAKENVQVSNGIIFEPEYDMSKIPTQEDVVKTTDLDLLYNLYDRLMSQYPNYISKANLSDAVYDEMGLDRPSYLNDNIFAYIFSPKLSGDYNGNVEEQLKPIKSMIVTGTHPDEWFNMFSVYRMMEMICKNWKSCTDCELIRTQVKVYVVPCLNPWGFRNSSRCNGNFGVNGNESSGVNLNRNFPTSNWAIDTSAYNNSGIVPGSEYETKVLMYYVNIVKPIVFIDYHTPRMDDAGHRGVWCGMSEKIYDQIGNSVLVTTANWLRKEDSNYPDLDKPLYFMENHLAHGEVYQWVAERRYGLSVLLEGGESNRWVNGVLTSSETEVDTPKLMRENIQYCFNALLRMIHVACKVFM